MGVAERYEERKKKKQGLSSLGVAERNELNGLQDKIDSYVADNNKLRSWLQTDSEYTGYRKNSSDWYKGYEKRVGDLRANGENIRKTVEKYKDILGDDYLKGFYDYYINQNKAYDDVLSAVKKNATFWGQWATEDDYNKDVEEAKRIDAALNYDFDKAEKELSELRKKNSETADQPLLAKAIAPFLPTDAQNKIVNGASEKKYAEAAVKQKEEEIENARQIQKYVSAIKMSDDELVQTINKAAADGDVDTELYYREIYDSRKRKNDTSVDDGKIIQLLGKSAYEGLASWNKGLTSTLDVLLGKPMQALGWENNPISSMADYYTNEYKKAQYRAQIEQNKLGNGVEWQTLRDITSNTVAAIPDALLAMMLGGAGSAQTTNTLRKTAAMAAAAPLEKAGITAQTMMQNPEYWTSFARELGTSYEEALNSGANEATAGLSSTIASLINAGIEIGIDGTSGIQGIPSAIKNGDESAIRTWVKGMIEEGNEEVLQGLVSKIAANMTYASSPAFSFGTGEGIVDPAEMAKEWGLGAAVGGILGGGQIGISSGVNAIANAPYTKIGRTIKSNSDIGALQDIASNMGADTEAYKLAFKLSADSKPVDIADAYYAVARESNTQLANNVRERLLSMGLSEDEATSYAYEVAKAINNGTPVRNPSDNAAVAQVYSEIKNGGANTYSNILAKRTGVESDAEYAEPYYNRTAQLGFLTNKRKQSAEEVKRNREGVKKTVEKKLGINVEDRVADSGKTTVVSEDKTASIKKILSIENGKMMLELNNGTVVDSADIKYSSDEEALAYESVLNLGLNPIVANNVLKELKKSNIPVVNFLNNVMLSYDYGMMNEEASLKDVVLPNDIKNTLFVVGRDAAKQNNTKKVDAAKNRKVNGKASNKVTYVNKINKRKLNDKQKSTIAVAEFMAKSTSLDIYVYESKRVGDKVYINLDGIDKESAANGWYIEGTNKIYIDINAGNNFEGLGVFTLAHESGHFIRDWNATEWQKMADLIVTTIDAQSKANGTKSFDRLLAEKNQKYIRNRTREETLIKEGKLQPENAGYAGKPDNEIRDMAYEDVICDSLASLMTDKETFVEFSNKLEQENHNLWVKLKNFIEDFLTKLDNWLKSYDGIKAEDDAGRAIQNTAKETRDQIRELYVAAFMGAEENYNSAEKSNLKAEDGNAVFSLKENENISKKSPSKKTHGQMFSDRDSDGSTKQTSDPAIGANENYNKAVERGMALDTDSVKVTNDGAILLQQRQYKVTAEQDAEYLELAKNPEKNEARLRELVDEAAKGAGFSTDTLFHGTSAFGFAKLDFSKSDDQISFFLSDSEEVASTYTPWFEGMEEKNTLVRDIGKPKQETSISFDDSIPELISKLRKRFNGQFFNSAREATEQDIAGYLNPFIADAKEGAKELLAYSIPENVEKFCNDILQANTYEDFRDALKGVKNTFDIYYNGMIFYQATSIFNRVRSASDTVGKFVGLKDLVYDESYGYPRIISKSDLWYTYNELTEGEGVGIYQLYTKNDNQLVIQGKGKRWDKLTLPSEMQEEIGKEVGTTRDISEWAYNHGYSSVKFDYIRDTGMYGTAYTNPSTVYSFLKGSEGNIRSADLVTYDGNGNIIPLSERFRTDRTDEDAWKNEDIRYQYRNLDLDTRTLLANALESVTQNEDEKNLLNQYKTQIDIINKQQNKLTELRKEIKDISFGKNTDRSKLPKLQKEANALATAITKQDKKLLDLEANKHIKDVLAREKSLAIKKAEKEGREALDEYRERTSRSMYVSKIEKIAYNLQKRLEHPTSKTAIPIAFAKSVAKFISALDFTTFDNDGNVRKGQANVTRAELRASISELADSLAEISIESDYGQYDISPDIIVWLKQTAEELDEKYGVNETLQLRQMTSEGLNTIYKTLRSLQTAVNQAGEFYRNKSSDVSDLAHSSWNYMKPLFGRSHSTVFDKAKKLLVWDYAQPISVFDRFGDAGRELMSGLMQGQMVHAKNVKAYTDFAENLYTKEEVNKWRTETHDIVIGDNTYRVTTAFLMEFHNLLNDPDARRHIIMGGGIRFADLEIKGQRQSFDTVVISLDEAVKIDRIISEDERLKTVAESMEKFMANTGAKWGNEISMARFGYEAFGGIDKYYPIRTIKANASNYEAQRQQTNIYALLNKSFTKERNIHANNAIIVGDMFDTFNHHMADMASYNAWALPVIDLIKWYNYKETYIDDNGKPHEDSTREVLRRAFGMGDKVNPADEYIRRLLEAINGQRSGGLSESVALISPRLVNRVAVAGNIRVAVQQPFSITRAFELISPKYCKPLIGKARAAAYQEMIDNSSFGLWKSMGYFDIDVAMPAESKIFKNETFADKVTEKSMFMAEDGDKFTWAVLWNACKEEAKEKNKSLSDEELLNKTKERFDDLILRTQVVDSVLTKSQWMREGSYFFRMTSAFMSEPMTSYNTLLRRYDAYMRDVAQYGIKKAFAKNGKIIAKTVAIFVMTQLVNALVTAPIDAMRDDDDYETFLEKMLDKFKGNAVQNLLPTGMMPFVADIAEYAIYGKTDRPDLQIWTKGIDTIYQTVSTIKNFDYFKMHKLINSALSMASSLSGIPMSNVTRDALAIWNTVVGNIGDGKLKFQIAKDSSSVAYEKMYKAISSGDTSRAAKLYIQMMSNGVEPTAVNTALNKYVKEEYISGKITEKRATELLEAVVEYTGKDLTDDDVYWKINKWKYEMETGSSDGYAKYGKFLSAVESGKNLKAVIKEYTDNGVDAKTLASQITSYFKPRYIEMPKSERASLKGYLLNAYALLGYSRVNKSNDIDAWLK